MNMKRFIIKSLQALHMEYEACKELLPEVMRQELEAWEKEAGRFFKELAMEFLKESVQSPPREETRITRVDID